MKKSLLFLFTSLAIVGCVPSWHPLYTEKDLISDNRMVRTWIDSDDKESCVVEKVGDKSYRLTQTDSDNKTAKFDAHLLKLQEKTCLDLNLTDVGDKGLQCNSLAQAMVVPAHLF